MSDWTQVHTNDEPLWALSRAFAYVVVANRMIEEIADLAYKAFSARNERQRMERMAALIDRSGTLELMAGPGFRSIGIPLWRTTDGMVVTWKIIEGIPFRLRLPDEEQAPLGEVLG
jgi:hypothetical protein